MLVYPLLYATDEDIALRASADFPLICPRDQKLAEGADGRLDSGDRWTLKSATVDFAAQGVAPGHVVQLQTSTAYPATAESFIVDSGKAGGVVLRRKGQPAGIGQPPAPAAGASGLPFLVLSFGPQIVAATDDLNRRMGIHPRTGGRTPSDVDDLGALRDAVVLSVLRRQYLDMSRASSPQSDVFAAKARLVAQELDDLLARLILHGPYLDPASGPGPMTNRIASRLSR